MDFITKAVNIVQSYKFDRKSFKAFCHSGLSCCSIDEMRWHPHALGHYALNCNAHHQLVEEIHRVVVAFDNGIWDHVFIKANCVADKMAKQALKISSYFVVHEIAPDCILKALLSNYVLIVPPKMS